MKITQQSINGKRYWRCDISHAGKRTQRYFKTKPLAQTFLDAYRNEQQEGLVRLSTLDNQSRHEVMAALEACRKAGLNISEVVQSHVAALGAYSAKTISSAVEECLEDKEASGLRRRSVATLRSTLKRFAFRFGPRLASEVTPTEIQEWLSGQEISLSTRKTYRIDIQTLFSWCERQHYCRSNPVSQTEPVRLTDSAPGILTVEQCQRLLAACREVYPPFIPYITLALFCGIRPAECGLLTWGMVNIKEGHVEVPAEMAKTRQRRLVTLSDNARAWLKLGGALPPKNIIFHMATIRAAAGIKEWPQDCMRHSFASYHLAMHGSADKTATQLGHRSSDMLFRHYRAIVTKQEAERFWSIFPLA